MNNVATLEKYVILNEENPIGYTYDIYTCIALLVHRVDSAIIAHIEATNRYIDLRQVFSILRLDDDYIKHIEVFKGPKTTKTNLMIIRRILENNAIGYDIKPANMDIYKKGSIGYNFVTKEEYFLNSDYELKRQLSLKP